MTFCHYHNEKLTDERFLFELFSLAAFNDVAEFSLCASPNDVELSAKMRKQN